MFIRLSFLSTNSYKDSVNALSMEVEGDPGAKGGYLYHGNEIGSSKVHQMP